MKKIFCLAIILAVFANVNTFSAVKKSNVSKTSSSKQVQAEPVKVAFRFLKEYANSGPDYIDNSNLISDKFRAKYHKEVEDYIAENDIIDYVPIVGGQDPSENYELISYDQNTGMVVAKPVYPGFDGEAEEVKLIVKNINGKWIIDDYIQTYF